MRKNKSIRLGDIAEGKDISGKKICFRVNRIEWTRLYGICCQTARTVSVERHSAVRNDFLTSAKKALLKVQRDKDARKAMSAFILECAASSKHSTVQEFAEYVASWIEAGWDESTKTAISDKVEGELRG